MFSVEECINSASQVKRHTHFAISNIYKRHGITDEDATPLYTPVKLFKISKILIPEKK